jgi:hypothetical protein
LPSVSAVPFAGLAFVGRAGLLYVPKLLSWLLT